MFFWGSIEHQSNEHVHRYNGLRAGYARGRKSSLQLPDDNARKGHEPIQKDLADVYNKQRALAVV